jgi:hypothetical protein
MKTAAMVLGIIGGLVILASLVFTFTAIHGLDEKPWFGLLTVLALVGLGGGVLIRHCAGKGGIIILAMLGLEWLMLFITPLAQTLSSILVFMGIMAGSPLVIVGGILALIAARKKPEAKQTLKNPVTTE